MSLVVESHESSTGTVLVLAGRIDSLTAPELYAAIGEVGASKPASITLDLGAVDYVSSAGLRSLLRSLKLVRRWEGTLHLAAPQPEVQKLLDVSGFTQLFTATTKAGPPAT